jgi:hypothetical protein
MYNTIQQINEEIDEIRKEFKKLRKQEDADWEKGTFDVEKYRAKFSYLQGRLDSLIIVKRIAQSNDH